MREGGEGGKTSNFHRHLHIPANTQCSAHQWSKGQGSTGMPLVKDNRKRLGKRDERGQGKIRLSQLHAYKWVPIRMHNPD